MNKRKVLIVDDSIIIRELLRKLIEKCGYTVCGTAKDGKEGIEMFNTLEPHIVFMDINMPIVDGIEAVKIIKKINADAKIVMLTAMGDMEMIRELEELGVALVLKKPIENHNIIAALASI